MEKRIIPISLPHSGEEEWLATKEPIMTGWLTAGSKVREFEEIFAKRHGVKYAMAVTSATTALHLALVALDIKEGDEVIVPAFTWISTANVVLYCGAKVVFVDVDRNTFNIDVNDLKQKITSKTKAIIPVHLFGLCADMDAVKKVAGNIPLVEDGACAAGAGYKGQPAGSLGTLGCFSFHPRKSVTTGEGGMITTNNSELYEKIKLLRTHGITKDSSRFTNPITEIGGIESYPSWYMEMRELGYNYRITDLQAALGLSQLKKAEKGLLRRREIAKLYSETLNSINGFKGQSGIIEGHAYHLYIIEVDNRLEVFNYLKSQNILTQIHYIPLHMMPYYKNFGWQIGDFPHAENYYSKCLSIPMYPSLEDNEVKYVISTLINRF